MKQTKPEPISINIVCSLCGEGWSGHGADPTTLDCIRLLKAKVRTQPYVYPVHPNGWWQSGGTTYTINASSNTTEARTPRQVEMSASSN